MMTALSLHNTSKNILELIMFGDIGLTELLIIVAIITLLFGA